MEKLDLLCSGEDGGRWMVQPLWNVVWQLLDYLI